MKFISPLVSTCCTAALLVSPLTEAATVASSPRHLEQTAQDDLDSARQLWSSFNTDHYFFEYDDVSSGTATSLVINTNNNDDDNLAGLIPATTLHGVHVQNNQVSNIFDIFGPVDVDPMNANNHNAAITIDDLFDKIQLAINNGYDQVIVSYDPTYGYPRSFIVFSTSIIAVGDNEDDNEKVQLFGDIKSFAPISQTLDDVRSAKSKWDGLDLESYSMTYHGDNRLGRPSALFSRESTGRGGSGAGASTTALGNNDAYNLVVYVENDAIKSVRSVSTGQFVSNLDYAASEISTINQLFRKLESDLMMSSTASSSTANLPTNIVIEYNQYYGFPEIVEIDLGYQPMPHHANNANGNDDNDDEDLDEEKDGYRYAISDFYPFQWRLELDESRKLWESQGITSYSFVFDMDDEHNVLQNEPPRDILVEDGVVLTVDGSSDNPDHIPSIDGLFNKIQTAFDDVDAASYVEVEYDQTYGYPTYVFIDYEAKLPGDEFSVKVDEFDILAVDDTILNSATASGGTTTTRSWTVFFALTTTAVATTLLSFISSLS